MDKVAGIVFFTAWLLCGCSVEKICDDLVGCGIDSIFESPKKACALIVAIIVTVLAAAVITIGDD